MKILDDTGLAYLWSKIKATFYTKAEVDSMISAFLATVTTNLTGITSDAPSRVVIGRSLVIHLTTSATIDTVEVMLGATDITSTAYNNGVITIAEVTDNVIITASVAVYSITTNLTDVTSDAPASIYGGTSLTINLSTVSGYGVKASTVSVTMGGNDITALAYSNGVITISSVSGNIVVTAEAELLYIIFEDPAVKAICVANWGGGTYPGEITPAEAAAVTTIGTKFQSSQITKFHEFRYFTGLTSNSQGAFQSSTIQEITIPPVNISYWKEFFADCSKLKSLDLSPLTATSYTNMRAICQRTYALTSLILPSGTYSGEFINLVFCQYANTAHLESIHFSPTVNVNSVTSFSNMISHQEYLTTITGTITNIQRDITFQYSPLTLSSILVILNGLKSGVSRTLTLKNTSGTYTNPIKGNAQYESIATDKGWTIAYS